MAEAQEATDENGLEDAALAALGLGRVNDPDYRKPVFKEGTKAKFVVANFEYVPADEDKKPYIAASFDYITPEEAAGETLNERWSTNVTPGDPKKPSNTGMALTTVTIQRLVAAIKNKPVKSPEVKEFFDGMAMFKDDIEGAYVPELLSRLSGLIGETFTTELEKGTTQQGGKYNTLGIPVYPDPEKHRPAALDKPYRERKK